MSSSIKAYYEVTKPGIIRGNALHVLAGALIASVLPLDWGTIAAVVVGTSFVIASACVANNYMDRGIDAKMKRTSARPSVTGRIPARYATFYGFVLASIGLTILSIWTNAIVVCIGIIAYVTYVLAYGWAKRKTVHSTIVGAIPGALPAMAGYVAIDGNLTAGAWLVFALVFFWQMPHFYAISLFRRKEYRSAGLPVLGAVKDASFVRRHMFVHLLLYVAVVVALITYDVVGVSAGALLVAASAYWMAVFGLTSRKDTDKWARSVFGASLLVVIALLGAAVLNLFVPPYT